MIKDIRCLLRFHEWSSWIWDDSTHLHRFCTRVGCHKRECYVVVEGRLVREYSNRRRKIRLVKVVDT